MTVLKTELWDHATQTLRTQAPITLFPPSVEQPPDEEEPPVGGGATLTLDIGTLPLGTSLPGLTPRWASTGWSVQEDASSLAGRVIRCDRGTASARQLLTVNAADAMPDRVKTQACAVWKAASPSSARVGLRLSGDSSATADGYVAGAESDTRVGFTKYTAGAASNTRVTQTLTPGSWYVTVVDDSGTDVRQRTWQFGTAEPNVWEPLLSDATTPPGWVGLFAFDAGGTTDFAFLSVGTGGQQAPRPQLPEGQNIPPLAEAGPGQSVLVGQTVTLAGSGSDADGTITSYAWAQTAGTAVTLSSTSVASPTFTAPGSPTTLTFRLTVTDDDGATGTDTVNVSVASGAVVTPTSSRGPNGTHWPPATPDPWAPATYTVATIDEAFVKLADCSGGECIVVTGTSSTGAGGSTKKDLNGGSMSWAQNVLIRGASLFTPITGEYTIRAHHVTLSGFKVTGELSMTGTDRSFIARTTWETNDQWLLNSTRDSGLYECVIPEYRAGGGDDVFRIGGSSGSGWVGSLRLSLVGCYLKSKMVPPPPAGGWTSATFPHCDTIQTYSPNADAVDTSIIDSVVFTAADKVFQSENGDVLRMKWINCWMDSPATSQEPIPSGWDMGPYGQSISGPGQDFLFEDCTILGAVNHKGSTTTNTGTFRRVKLRGGSALSMNNPTKIDVVESNSLSWDTDPPPALPTLSAIWAP